MTIRRRRPRRRRRIGLHRHRHRRRPGSVARQADRVAESTELMWCAPTEWLHVFPSPVALCDIDVTRVAFELLLVSLLLAPLTGPLSLSRRRRRPHSWLMRRTDRWQRSAYPSPSRRCCSSGGMVTHVAVMASPSAAAAAAAAGSERRPWLPSVRCRPPWRFVCEPSTRAWRTSEDDAAATAVTAAVVAQAIVAMAGWWLPVCVGVQTTRKKEVRNELAPEQRGAEQAPQRKPKGLGTARQRTAHTNDVVVAVTTPLCEHGNLTVGHAHTHRTESAVAPTHQQQSSAMPTRMRDGASCRTTAWRIRKRRINPQPPSTRPERQSPVDEARRTRNITFTHKDGKQDNNDVVEQWEGPKMGDGRWRRAAATGKGDHGLATGWRCACQTKVNGEGMRAESGAQWAGGAVDGGKRRGGGRRCWPALTVLALLCGQSASGAEPQPAFMRPPSPWPASVAQPYFAARTSVSRGVRALPTAGDAARRRRRRRCRGGTRRPRLRSASARA